MQYTPAVEMTSARNARRKSSATVPKSMQRRCNRLHEKIWLSAVGESDRFSRLALTARKQVSNTVQPG